jgi:hypothetical protein
MPVDDVSYLARGILKTALSASPHREETLFICPSRSPLGTKRFGALGSSWHHQRTVGELVGNRTLKTQEELDAAKQQQAIEQQEQEQQQKTDALMDIASLKYYLSFTGIWHTDKNCIENVNSIAINPLDLIQIPNVKPCSKCVRVN